MAIITLISDWGDEDYYPAAVKGIIYSLMPNAIVVDITHRITPFDMSQAAYVLRNAYHNFPKGSIHIIGINTEESLKQPHTVAYYNGHYFIGSDNGIFSLIFSREPDEMIALDIFQQSNDYSFSSRDRFAKAAVEIAQGKALNELGTLKKSLLQKTLFKPAANSTTIYGMVIHIDPYENIITNITRNLYDNVIDKKPFVIKLKSFEIHKISDTYSDVNISEIVCFFGSNGLLQIAINKGNAASLLNVKIRDTLTIGIDDTLNETDLQLF